MAGGDNLSGGGRLSSDAVAAFENMLEHTKGNPHERANQFEQMRSRNLSQLRGQKALGVLPPSNPPSSAAPTNTSNTSEKAAA
ncbi:hypothetical protein FWG86_02205 [Candidatus Saccharibacteria bacterium]|nr:hypothetical protein [Candidatus Saccharibacteria bacterium]